MAIKNPSNSSTSNSETSHSPSPKNQEKGKAIIIHISSRSDFEATMTITSPHAKGIVIGFPKKKSFMKAKKSGRKR